MAWCCFHIFITSCIIISFWVAMPQNCNSFWTSCMHTNWMIRTLIREFPIGYFLGITTTPAWPNAHMIPTFAPLKKFMHYKYLNSFKLNIYRYLLNRFELSDTYTNAYYIPMVPYLSFHELVGTPWYHLHWITIYHPAKYIQKTMLF